MPRFKLAKFGTQEETRILKFFTKINDQLEKLDEFENFQEEHVKARDKIIDLCVTHMEDINYLVSKALFSLKTLDQTSDQLLSTYEFSPDLIFAVTQMKDLNLSLIEQIGMIQRCPLDIDDKTPGPIKNIKDLKPEDFGREEDDFIWFIKMAEFENIYFSRLNEKYKINYFIKKDELELVFPNWNRFYKYIIEDLIIDYKILVERKDIIEDDD